jgi:hypothetical protein
MSGQDFSLLFTSLVHRIHLGLPPTPVSASTELALTPRGASTGPAPSGVNASTEVVPNLRRQARLTCVRAWTPFLILTCIPAALTPVNTTLKVAPTSRSTTFKVA